MPGGKRHVSSLQDKPSKESTLIEMAQASDLEGQLAILLRHSVLASGALSALAGRFDQASRCLEVIAVEGALELSPGRVVQPSDPVWRSLAMDGVLRQALLNPACVIGVNLFVPTADPDVQKAVVHLEWRDKDDLRIETLQELIGACGFVRNLIPIASGLWKGRPKRWPGRM